MEYKSDYNGSRDKEVKVDIEIDQHESQLKVAGSEWGKKTLKKLISGVLGFNGSADDDDDETSKPDNNIFTGLLGEPSQGVIEAKEKKKLIKKAPKPPRPPRGPSLDAADIRLIKEISKISMKKRERIERVKAVKKTRLPLSSASSPSPSTSSSSTSTISALIITVLFFLVLIFQGVGRGYSRSDVRLGGAPQPSGPAPETSTESSIHDPELMLLEPDG